MKNVKKIYKSVLIILVIISCTDNRDLGFLEEVVLPSNISALFDITQDNSGLVTITPSGEGASTFEIGLGDSSESVRITSGESIENIYTEGSYDVSITAFNIVGDSTQVNQQLVVSFQAPQNLEVVIENDASTSKQVNISASADFATSYEFYSGETGIDQPVATANIGDGISYDYETPGIYSVKIVAKGGAIETTEYTEDFEVTEIVFPLSSAPTPPNRNDVDVVSVFSDVYTDETLNELPTTWSSTNFEEANINSDNIWKLTSLDFLGIVTNYDAGIDLSEMEKMHIDYWVPEGTTNELFVKIVNTVDGGEDLESLGATTGGSWQSIELDITAFDGGDLANKEKITQILIDSDGETPVAYIDNFYFYRESTTSSFDDGLLTNGDFEGGSAPWIVGVDDASPAPVVTVGDNTYYSVDVTAAGNVYDVNVSQKVEIIGGNTYTLTFDAWSNTNRSIDAGIGLSADPWSNDKETIQISPTRTTFALTLSASGFGAPNARVLFDIGGEIGLVNIDNVSLILGSGNLLTNGNFEAGSAPWIVGVNDTEAAPVVTVADNTYYSRNVTAAGNVYDVNVSQKVEIIQGKTYFLTFVAWSDTNRSIDAGIGLSADPWSNDKETIQISPTKTTFTLTLEASNFGATDARVLFDIGGEVGEVNIDDVSLSMN
ncbi:carbohydrate binding domain-containing protein [Flavobacteriaceae bacterium]|nr:carbohydrate binding domain-containing protein [Flavobacteriaceae bacterium]MDA9328076.1 carbohydrate binding domain-containing protein [Flavobacteriaceae bacterium]